MVTACVPLLLGVGSGYHSKSSAGSSGGSSSGRQSDLIQQYGSGSDTTEIRHITNSDVSIVCSTAAAVYWYLIGAGVSKFRIIFIYYPNMY